MDLTKKLKEGGKLLDIQILDHIIITSEAYYSFADDLTGAAFSRLDSGNGVITIIVPLLIACVVITSWLLRS